MQDKKMKTRTTPTQAELGGEFGIRTEINSQQPYQSVTLYAGDSVDEHKQLERANEEIAENEIQQMFENG